MQPKGLHSLNNPELTFIPRSTTLAQAEVMRETQVRTTFAIAQPDKMKATDFLIIST